MITDMQPEVRTFGAVPALSGDGMTFSGHAALFNTKAYIGAKTRGFNEQFSPGAFSKVLKGDVRMVLNHDPNQLLGRTGSGTVRLSEDEIGLHVEGDLPDTSLGRDTATLIRRGDISGQSIQFTVGRDEWETEKGGHAQLRTIHEVANLIDVGPVVYPAYQGTTASVRAALVTAPAEVRSAILELTRDRARRTAVAADDDTKALIAAVDAAVDALASASRGAEDVVDQLMQRLGIFDPAEPADADEAMPQANSARTGPSINTMRARLRLAQLAQGSPLHG